MHQIHCTKQRKVKVELDLTTIPAFAVVFFVLWLVLKPRRSKAKINWVLGLEWWLNFHYSRFNDTWWKRHRFRLLYSNVILIRKSIEEIFATCYFSYFSTIYTSNNLYYSFLFNSVFGNLFFSVYSFRKANLCYATYSLYIVSPRVRCQLVLSYCFTY